MRTVTSAEIINTETFNVIFKIKSLVAAAAETVRSVETVAFRAEITETMIEIIALVITAAEKTVLMQIINLISIAINAVLN